MSKYICPGLFALALAAVSPAFADPGPPAPPAPSSPPPAAAPASADDGQDKLSIALHSYYLLQQENADLKGSLGAEVETLRAQLRQAQNEIATLSAENAALKTRLALAGPAPGSGRPVPTRPSP